MPKFIRFSRDVRLPGGIEYLSRVWYPVPNDVAQQLQKDFPDLAVDVQNRLPDVEAPAGDSVASDLEALLPAAPPEPEEPKDEEPSESEDLESESVVDEGPEAEEPESPSEEIDEE